MMSKLVLHTTVRFMYAKYYFAVSHELLPIIKHHQKYHPLA